MVTVLLVALRIIRAIIVMEISTQILKFKSKIKSGSYNIRFIKMASCPSLSVTFRCAPVKQISVEKLPTQATQTVVATITTSH